MNDSENGGPMTILAETENYAVVLGHDDEGEPIYNIELDNLTLHLYGDEWEELVNLIRAAASANQ